MFTTKCRIDLVWPKMKKFIRFYQSFETVPYIAMKNHVPLPRFPETFSMWYRTVLGRKWYRFHYCCNLWWVYQYILYTLDYWEVFIKQPMYVLDKEHKVLIQICSIVRFLSWTCQPGWQIQDKMLTIFQTNGWVNTFSTFWATHFEYLNTLDNIPIRNLLKYSQWC